MINGGLWFKEVKEQARLAVPLGCLLAGAGILSPLVFPWVSGWLAEEWGGIPLLVSAGKVKWLPATFFNYSWILWTTLLGGLLSLFSLLIGAKSLAGEIRGGTAVFLSSKPVSPREVVTTKFFAGIFYLFMLVLLPSFLFSLAAIFSGLSFYLVPFWTSSLICLVGVMAVYAGGLFFSSLHHNPWWAGLSALVFWVLISLPGFLVSAHSYSFFYYLRSLGYFLEGQTAFIPLGVNLVTAFLFYEVSVYAWERREL